MQRASRHRYPTDDSGLNRLVQRSAGSFPTTPDCNFTAFHVRSVGVCNRLWLVLNDDFRPAASHIRSSPGEADRIAARIWTQAQRKQIGETEGSLDVEPVVRFQPDAH